jgi:chemotaxis methyl-accepting protein methylase
MAFSFFFRDLQIIDLAVNFVIPDLVGRSRPSIWDAVCAMEQEPYTLAMALADSLQTQKMPDVLSGMFRQLSGHCQVFRRVEVA